MTCYRCGKVDHGGFTEAVQVPEVSALCNACVRFVVTSWSEQRRREVQETRMVCANSVYWN